MDDNKPLIIKVKETEDEIVKIINSSGIPAFIIKPSIEKILTQLNQLEQKEFLDAKRDYSVAQNFKKKSKNSKGEKNDEKSIDNGK